MYVLIVNCLSYNIKQTDSFQTWKDHQRE